MLKDYLPNNRIFISTLALFFFACGGGEEIENPESSDCGDNAIEVTLENLTGLDGCTWMLVSSSMDERMEPTNLSDYIPDPKMDQVYVMTIIDRPDIATTCMAGRIVEITCLE